MRSLFENVDIVILIYLFPEQSNSIGRTVWKKSGGRLIITHIDIKK